MNQICRNGKRVFPKDPFKTVCVLRVPGTHLLPLTNGRTRKTPLKWSKIEGFIISRKFHDANVNVYYSFHEVLILSSFLGTQQFAANWTLVSGIMSKWTHQNPLEADRPFLWNQISAPNQKKHDLHIHHPCDVFFFNKESMLWRLSTCLPPPRFRCWPTSLTFIESWPAQNYPTRNRQTHRIHGIGIFTHMNGCFLW